MEQNASNVIETILATLTQIFAWIMDSIQDASALYFAEGSVTLIGAVTLIGFGIAVSLMFLAWIRSLLRGQ